MLDLIAVVEGRSEQRVATTLLAPHLAQHGIRLRAAPVGKPGQPGGVRGWPGVERDLCRHLRSGGRGRVVCVTTMFDYYHMPLDWPGRASDQAGSGAHHAVHVESQMHTTICASLGPDFPRHRFVPYVQMHELEALLLVDPMQLEVDYVERRREVRALADSVRGMKPEEINDSEHTAPSKRIIRHVPEYEADKTIVIPAALERIGLAALRHACPHFDSWITRLEALAPAPPTR